jgi:hypothetical protein
MRTHECFGHRPGGDAVRGGERDDAAGSHRVAHAMGTGRTRLVSGVVSLRHRATSAVACRHAPTALRPFTPTDDAFAEPRRRCAPHELSRRELTRYITPPTISTNAPTSAIDVESAPVVGSAPDEAVDPLPDDCAWLPEAA